MTAGLVVLWFWAPEDVTRTATFLPLLCWNRAADLPPSCAAQGPAPPAPPLDRPGHLSLLHGRPPFCSNPKTERFTTLPSSFILHQKIS